MQNKEKAKIRMMKVNSLGITTILIFIFSLSAVPAQESINASGGNASGSEGSVCWSIGQLIYETHKDTDGSLAEGVQQPYEISTYTAIEKSKEITLSAYPNPTADFLTLSIDGLDISYLFYQIYDMNGKLLQFQKITTNQSFIDMSNLVSSTYFLKVIKGKIEIKTYKIIKN